MKQIVTQNGKIRYELSSEEKKFIIEEVSKEGQWDVLDYLCRCAKLYYEKDNKIIEVK